MKRGEEMKSYQRFSCFAVSLFLGFLPCLRVSAGDDLKPYKVPMLSPEDALKSFVIADG